jgi:phosphoribosylformylglycinamidine cyclo-ligase
MVAVVAAEVAEAAVARLSAAGVPAWVAGTISTREDASGPAARLVGSYR